MGNTENTWEDFEKDLIRKYYPTQSVYGDWIKQLKPNHQAEGLIRSQAKSIGVRVAPGYHRSRLTTPDRCLSAAEDYYDHGLLLREIGEKYGWSTRLSAKAICKARIIKRFLNKQ